jgi:putative sigma-54 modulation protein
MQLDIKTKDMDLTDGIRAHIEEKMAHLDKKLARFGTSVTTEVEVGRTTHHHHKGDVFRAEIHVRLPGNTIYAEATAEDLYAAIGMAKEEADRQIVDYKEKLQDSHRGGVDEAI